MRFRQNFLFFDFFLLHKSKILTVVKRNVSIFSATSFLFAWNSTGITVAGITGSFGTADNQLTNPFGVTLDSLDTLFVADRGNNRVQKWLPGASNGTTVAGQSNGTPGTGLDYLTQPGNVNIDSSGNVYVTEVFNYRVLFWPGGASSGTLIAGNGKRSFQTFFSRSIAECDSIDAELFNLSAPTFLFIKISMISFDIRFLGELNVKIFISYSKIRPKFLRKKNLYAMPYPLYCIDDEN